MGFHLLTFKRPGIHSWRGCITLHYQQPQENCACQTIGWSILGFSVLLKRLKDALLFIFDNILLTRLWSVSTSADSPDGTPHAIFFLDLPSAATVQHGTKDKLDSELIHRLSLCGKQRKPTHKQAHLVLPTRKSHAEKPKEPVFGQLSKSIC